MNIRDAFLAVKLKEETVKVPELGKEVIVREMDAARLDQYESMIYRADEDGKVKADTKNMHAKLVICCVYDLDGNPVFTPDDLDHLSHCGGKMVKRLAEKAVTITGLYSAEETEKN